LHRCLPCKQLHVRQGNALPISFFANQKTKTLQNVATITNVTYSAGAFIVTAANRYEAGDIVQISSVLGPTEINSQLIVLYAGLSGTQFTAAAAGAGLSAAYISGGTSTHLGWVTPAISTAALQNDFTLLTDVFLQTWNSAARFVYEDSADGVTFNTLATRHSVSPLNAAPQPPSPTFVTRSLRNVLPQDLADVNIGESSALRLKIFIVSAWGSVPGNAVLFSASLRN
jgi:hypothetical protein